MGEVNNITASLVLSVILIYFHPEVSTIRAVFGVNEVVPRSLDLTRDVTPVTEWMNGISSYSMWWVRIHEDLWMHYGDRKYLAAQQPYLTVLLKRLAGLIGPDGREPIDGMRFLDWPSSSNQQGVTAGLQGLLVTPLEPGCQLVRIAPQLGNLQWVEGDYPTPHGIIHVRHDRRPDGSIQSKITGPPGVKVDKAQ